MRKKTFLFLLIINFIFVYANAQREHKISFGPMIGFEFPGMHERIGGDDTDPVRLLPGYSKTISKGFFIGFDNVRVIKPELYFMHMDYTDWMSESGSFLFMNSNTTIDYFGLNLRRMKPLGLNSPAYFYFEGGIHYGLINFSRDYNRLLEFEDREVPMKFSSNSFGVQYGIALHYAIFRRLDMTTKICARNSFFSDKNLVEDSNFTYGFHFGIAYKFRRELNPFSIR